MHRTYCAEADFRQETISLTDKDEIHHIKDVLRLKEGSPVLLFNGQGLECQAVIRSIHKESLELQIKEIRAVTTASTPPVSLACAIPKKAKFENIIEKCTELGIAEIIPLLTQRTLVRLNEKQAANKQKRYQTVLVNAAKQCRRNDLPIIRPAATFANFLPTIDKNTFALIPCLAGERQHFLEVMRQRPPGQKILILIGPEGDFTPAEIQQAVESGCRPVSLGDNVLKVDTAAIVTIAVTQFFLNS